MGVCFYKKGKYAAAQMCFQNSQVVSEIAELYKSNPFATTFTDQPRFVIWPSLCLLPSVSQPEHSQPQDEMEDVYETI